MKLLLTLEIPLLSAASAFSAFLQGAGNAMPNPSSETARTIASHFSFRFMGSALRFVSRITPALAA